MQLLDVPLFRLSRDELPGVALESVLSLGLLFLSNAVGGRVGVGIRVFMVSGFVGV